MTEVIGSRLDRPLKRRRRMLVPAVIAIALASMALYESVLAHVNELSALAEMF